MTGPPGAQPGPRLRALAARAAVAAGVLCAALAPLAVVWLSGRTLAWFDTQRLYAPERGLVEEALRAFRLPLWNPFMGGGMPLLADAIHGVLHPVSIATAWLRTDRSVDVLAGGYVGCAALGAFLLVRDLGASRSGAAVSAFSYALSGFVLSMAANLVFLAGAASLPLCVAGLRRAAVVDGAGGVAAAAGGVAVLAFSGDAQALGVGLALGGVLAWEGGGWRGALRALGAGALGVLVAGVQLVPSAVHVPRTVRSAETWVPEPAVWVLEPWRLAELLVPGLLRGPDPYVDPVYAALAGPGAWPSYGTPMPFAASVSFGLLPAALALAGARTGRRGVVLSAAALALLWIALGPALGADRVLGEVPLWRAFRYPEKLVGPMALCLAALAGLGADAVLGRRVPGWQVLAGAAGLGIAALAAAHLAAGRLAPELEALARGRIARGTWHLAGAAAACAAWVAARERLGPRVAAPAAAALVWAGAAAAAPLAFRPGDPEARLRAPGPALLAPAPGPRIASPWLHDLRERDPGPESMDRAAREHALLGYPAYNVGQRLDSLNEYSAMTPARLSILAADGWSHWPLAPRRYGATHVVLDPPTTPVEAALHARVTGGGTLVAAVPGRFEIWAVPHRPWASFAGVVRVEPDARRALAQTAETLAAGDGPVVVEAYGRFDAAPGRVLAVERGRESLRVEAESAAEGTLVVADAFWPGWEATIDGTPASIFRADGLVRAVRWPAGRHVLEMSYRPPEVRTGLLASGLGLVLAAGWAALRQRGMRRARR